MGCRIGEASNPGPSQPQTEGQTFNLNFINVTKLRKHSDEVMNLHEQFPGITMLAETSADERAIAYFQRAAARKRLSFFTGAPCGTRLDCGQGRPLFGGVGALTSQRSRMPSAQVEWEGFCSTRYLETITQVGNIQILCIVLYLHPEAENFSLFKKDINESLLQQAVTQATIWNGFSIIAADFNGDVTRTDAWTTLKSVGWGEAHGFAEEVFSNPTLPTYDDASKIDSILFSPQIAKYVTGIRTIREFQFPRHHPLVVQCRLDAVQNHFISWISPMPFSEEQMKHLGDDQFNDIFIDFLNHGDLDPESPNGCTFEDWSLAVERAVHKTLLLKSAKGLKAVQRGRGQPPRYKQFQFEFGAKIARNGDFAPSTHLASTHHKQVVRQVRRLESIQRMLRKFGDLEVETVARDWNAVQQSSGFPGGFARWANQDLPRYPSDDIIRELCGLVIAYEAQLAKDIAKEKKKAWIDRLNASWKTHGNRVSHQVSKTRGFPFLARVHKKSDLLCKNIRQTGKGPPIYCLPFAPPQDSQIFWNNQLIPWISLAQGTFSIPYQGNEVTVTLSQWLLDPPRMQQEFFSYWSQFWESDDRPFVDPDLIRPEWNLDYTPILTLESLNQAIQHTKSNTAPGADGWRIDELKALGDIPLAIWVQVFNHILNGSQPWPDVFCWARVVLPGKCENPTRIADGRPINILSLLYRLGLKAVTREVLLKMTSVLPSSIIGGLPKRRGDTLWYSTQYLIEQALSSDSELHGTVTDLQKFFNTIPRRFLEAILIKFGIDANFVRQWLSFLHQLRRCVVIQHDTSAPRLSSCGVPEGDPFAVVAAIAIGAALHSCVTRHTESQVLIYIDNIELISSSSQDICDGTEVALEFFRQWNFKVDLDKSWAWTTVSTRCFETKSNFAYCNAKQNLGSYARYKRSNKHGTLTSRIAEGTRRAGIIASLPSEQQARLDAVAAGPIQVALYGSEVSYIGKKALKPMQRHVARILAKPHKGVNPNAVLLTYRSGILEPRICAIVRAARSARRAIHTMPIVFKDFWSRLVDDPGDPNRTYGPLSVLATYFKSLGIKPHVGGYLTLQGISPVDFIDGPFASVEEILLTAWARQVQAELRERYELEDLAHVSPELTYRALKKIDPKDAKVVRTYLCGGFPTNSQAHHWKNIQTDCPCCGEQDTRARRIKRCTATREVRRDFAIIDALGETQAAAPWAVHTEERSTIAKLIQGIPFPSVEEPVDVEGQLVCFTDGSCIDSKLYGCAQASWAVVYSVQPLGELDMVPPREFQTIVSQFQVFKCGRVPGRQTITRAEILAIACAFQASHDVHVISDSKTALQITQDIISGACIARYCLHPNFDVVNFLFEAIHKWPLSLRNVTLTKVKSHFIPERPGRALVLAAGNEAADRAAKAVLNCQIHGFTHLFHALSQQTRHSDNTLPTLYKAIAHAIRSYVSKAVEHESFERIPPVRENIYTGDFPLRYYISEHEDEWRRASPWGVTFNLKLMQWLQELHWPPEDAATRHVTWNELLVSFRLHSGLCIPTVNPKLPTTFLTPGIHKVFNVVQKTLGGESFAFRSSLQSLSTVLGQPLVPWHRAATCVNTHEVFGYSWRVAGFVARPRFPFEQETIDILHRFFAKQPGKLSTGTILKITAREVAPEPEDIAHDPELQRRGYIRFARLRHRCFSLAISLSENDVS